MACGCGKPKQPAVMQSPAAMTASAAASQAKQSGTVTEYDVFGSDGGLVTSSRNPVLARGEARRVGGTVVPRKTTV